MNPACARWMDGMTFDELENKAKKDKRFAGSRVSCHVRWEIYRTLVAVQCQYGFNDAKMIYIKAEGSPNSKDFVLEDIFESSMDLLEGACKKSA